MSEKEISDVEGYRRKEANPYAQQSGAMAAQHRPADVDSCTQAQAERRDCGEV